MRVLVNLEIALLKGNYNRARVFVVMPKLYAAVKRLLVFNWATRDEDVGMILRYEGHISIFKVIFFVFFMEIIQNYLPTPLADLVNVSHDGVNFMCKVVIRKFCQFFGTLGGPIW